MYSKKSTVFFFFSINSTTLGRVAFIRYCISALFTCMGILDATHEQVEFSSEIFFIFFFGFSYNPFK